MKGLVLLALCVTVLAGCGGVRPRMSYNDLNNYRVDCANKAAQIRFLESQISTRDERIAAAFNVDAILRFFSLEAVERHDANMHISNRSTDAIARNILWTIRSQCP